MTVSLVAVIADATGFIGVGVKSFGVTGAVEALLVLSVRPSVCVVMVVRIVV